ncbi:hypothetical protein BpHYR1_022839 [Brachionus plicatilis]|uniref:Uncharacterized protein n=1 Tax=Brachionus plicatilis TaxID=10195 RepID=A0A3M7P9C9_BRAPC|nr:hypothetical protein BpHYR1_022839 [Brachionus plicatilis]
MAFLVHCRRPTKSKSVLLKKLSVIKPYCDRSKTLESRIGLEKSDWEIKVYQQAHKYYSGAQFAEQFTNSKRSERTHETERTQVVLKVSLLKQQVDLCRLGTQLRDV